MQNTHTYHHTYLGMELCHLLTQQLSKLAQNILVPRVILEGHFALHLGIVHNNGPKAAPSV